MSAKDQVLQLVNKFKKENFLRDKTDAMGDGLLLSANLADDANETSNAVDKNFKALQQEYTENGNGSQSTAEILVARDGEEVLEDRLKRDYEVFNKKLNDFTVSPDDFEGTDFEKVQAAVNKACDQRASIRLSRAINITAEEPIMVNKPAGRWTLKFIGEGGGFKKTSAGPMFSTDNEFAADINFSNVAFESIWGSGTSVFDADKLIIITTNLCTFSNVDKYMSSTTYAQSYRSIGDRVTGGKGYFIETPSMYDFVCTNILVEVRESFFRQTKATSGAMHTRLYNVRFRDSTIEGLTGEAMRFRDAEILTIDGTYLEMNSGGNIIFDDDSKIDGVSISNSRGHEKADNPNPKALVAFGGKLTNVKTENNIINNGPVMDTSKVTDGHVISARDYSGINSIENIDPDKRIIKRDGPAWLRVEGTTNVATSDNVVKLSKHLENQVLNSYERKTFQLLFSRDLYLDDLITVQIYSGYDTDFEYRYVRNSVNKKILEVTVKNNSTVAINLSFYATVLKFDRIASQKG